MARILIIDDDAEVRAMLRLTLQEVGHRVVEAADGDEGLRIQDEQAADLVLCDVFMPGRDGLGTIRALRRRHASTRIIAMSGGSARVPGDYLAIAERLGACSSLCKPLDLRPESVLGVVASALSPPKSTGTQD